MGQYTLAVWGNIWELPCAEIGGAVLDEGRKLVCDYERIPDVSLEPFNLDLHFLLVFLTMGIDAGVFTLYCELQTLFEKFGAELFADEMLKRHIMAQMRGLWQKKSDYGEAFTRARQSTETTNFSLRYFNN